MRKSWFVFGVCFLFFGAAATATSFYTLDALEEDVPPEWATGNFTGEWGISVFGVPFIALGWVKGFYENTGLVGRMEGVFAEYNKSETAKIGGFLVGPFFIGAVGNETTGNWTYAVGLGVFNVSSSEFYFRLMGLFGPNYYMYGTYSEFETTTVK
ncbi:MAG TPA: hypothetical protein ENI42_03520 [Thermoplasmatales archaeon]|nr:hypothetical protein [Thermoplasmatales archaeon]